MTYASPSELPSVQRVELDADAYGRPVHATRIGGIVVYEVPGIETAQPAAKPFARVYELLAAHAPADPIEAES
jgi:hypothetical protein